MKPWFVVAALATALGCAKKDAPSGDGANFRPGVGPAPAAMQADPIPLDLTPGVTLPPDVLVDVDGRRLTRADAERDAGFRAEAQRKQLPPDRASDVDEKALLAFVVDQFVLRAVLLNEADRKGVKTEKADEDAAFAQIAARLPPGTTIEQVMKQSPMGEARMREEVLVGVRINKLMDAALASSIQVTPEEIARFREQFRERLNIPDSVHARHILVATAREDDEAARAGKRAKAEGLRAQLTNGADFAELARSQSDCPSREKGGDLGTFPRGQMVKAFEDAAFSQADKAVGPVVESDFGYHIIQVLEHVAAHPVPDEQVRGIVTSRKRQKSVEAYVADLRDKAKVTYSPSLKRPPAPAGAGSAGG